jgi:hypothetical protein
MHCRTIAAGPGMTAIVCGGRQRRTTCSTPACGRDTVALCDYPVMKKGKETTCSARICDRCRASQPEDRDFCPPHYRIANSRAPIPTSTPARGDCRVHIPTGKKLYIVEIRRVDGRDFVTFAQNPPDVSERCLGPMQTVPLDDWNKKTRSL